MKLRFICFIFILNIISCKDTRNNKDIIEDEKYSVLDDKTKSLEILKKQDDFAIYGKKNIFDEDIFMNIYNSPEYYNESDVFEYIVRNENPLHKGGPGNEIIVKNDEIIIYFWPDWGKNYKLQFVTLLEKTDKYLLSKYIGEYSNTVYNEYTEPYPLYKINRIGENHIYYENRDGWKFINFTLQDAIVQKIDFGFEP
jgi:hypothetical protein